MERVEGILPRLPVVEGVFPRPKIHPSRGGSPSTTGKASFHGSRRGRNPSRFPIPLQLWLLKSHNDQLVSHVHKSLFDMIQIKTLLRIVGEKFRFSDWWNIQYLRAQWRGLFVIRFSKILGLDICRVFLTSDNQRINIPMKETEVDSDLFGTPYLRLTISAIIASMLLRI